MATRALAMTGLDMDGWNLLESGAAVHSTAIVYPGVQLGAQTIVHSFTTVGQVDRRSVREQLFRAVWTQTVDSSPDRTVVGTGCDIGSHSVIYSGVVLEDHVVCREYTLVCSGSRIGTRSKLHYRAQVHSDVSVGSDGRIGGFCCDGSVIGDRCSVYGALVHHYAFHGFTPLSGAPTIADDVVVGMRAIIVGGVTIGANSYVAAGAVVTRDVPASSIVVGVNIVTPFDAWRGRLREFRVEQA